MRGTAGVFLRYATESGITPAHAGNRTIQQLKLDTIKDHPRTCGEQGIRTAKKDWLKGSPPHMRGTECKENGMELFKGITPAHAGNSLL